MKNTATLLRVIFLWFLGSAILSGSQHYTTFDGVSYEFSGDTTYLLAADMAQNRFSILVSYNPKQPKHRDIILYMLGKKITLTHDFKVNTDKIKIYTHTISIIL